jgi:outer membrane protein OmpA-like peptidoglycan-associated protein
MRNALKIFFLLMLVSKGSFAQNFFERYEYSLELLPLINTAGSEISPAFVNDTLFFSAVRDDSNERGKSKSNDKSFYDVYYTQTDIKGYPQILRKLVPGFGKFYHEGPVSFCEATNELFVTVSNISKEDTLQRISRKKHIRLRLVIMKKSDEKWSIVEELPFNQDEYHYAHPAISATGDTLIFSSDRPGGLGQSDLYMSIRNEGEWSEPENLGDSINTAGNEMFPTFGPSGLLLFSSDGHPDSYGQLDIYYARLNASSSVTNLGESINSESDDFGLIIDSSQTYGYLASNRRDAGSDDIYRVGLVSLYEEIGGRVMDNKEVPVPDAEVRLQDCNGTVLQTTQSSSGGRFNFEVLKGKCYQVEAAKQGYLTDSKPYHLEKSVMLNLVQLIKYQITVFDMEKEEPISEGRILCADKQWPTNKMGFADIPANSIGNCKLIVTGEDYFNYIIDADPYRFNPGVDLSDTIRLFRKELNYSYTFDNINFFLDKWRLLPESEQELNLLIKLMKDNPSLKIELASHTDSRGEAQYNLWLSQKRSDSAKDYLIENGIQEERIVSQGYGESKLINRCANGVPCSEAEHLENRRTEFKTLNF